MRRLVRWLIGLGFLGVVGLLLAFGAARWLTRETIEVPDHQPDVDHGAVLFAVAGCANCHTVEGDDAQPLAGGRALETPFGTFYGPNITPDPEHGIGGWTDAEFLAAMSQGVAPDGGDYYPVFPYTSFTHMTPEDMLDLKAYLFSQPAVAQPNLPHVIAFPYEIRQVVTFWKLLNFESGTIPDDPAHDDAWNRGRYLVTALGHCGECHTPRDGMGAAMTDMLLAGTETGPTGDPVPNITPDPETGIGGWSERDLAFFLQAGMTPSGDFAGGEMSEVIRGTAELTDEDRAAIASYLLSLPPINNQVGPPRPAPSEGGGEVWD